MSPTVTKQYNIRFHSSSKLTPIQAKLKKSEAYVYQNLLDKRKKIKPKLQVNDLVRTADYCWKRSLKVIILIGPTSYAKLQKYLIIQNRIIVLTIYQRVITKPCWKIQIYQRRKMIASWKKYISHRLNQNGVDHLRLYSLSFLLLLKQTYIPAGTISGNLNTTFIGWAASIFFWYLISKTYKLYPISSPSLDDLKIMWDIYGWKISSLF